MDEMFLKTILGANGTIGYVVSCFGEYFQRNYNKFSKSRWIECTSGIFHKQKTKSNE